MAEIWRMIRIERAAAFQPQTETIFMVQEGDHLQWALFPFSSPMLGAPETSPSCISSSLTCARHSAWSCHCMGAALEGGQSKTQKWLVWFGLLFGFFFLIQKCHLHPAVSILEICWVLFSSCGSVWLMLQLQNPWQPVSRLKATIHESPCPGQHLLSWEHPEAPFGQPPHHSNGNGA